MPKKIDAAVKERALRMFAEHRRDSSCWVASERVLAMLEAKKPWVMLRAGDQFVEDAFTKRHQIRPPPTRRGKLDSEPVAWQAGTAGSESAPAQQCAGATRRTLVPRADRQDPTARGLPLRARPDHRDLITAVEAYLDTHDNDPRPFTWTATAEEIVAKSRQRARRPSCGYPTLRPTIGCVDDGSPRARCAVTARSVADLPRQLEGENSVEVCEGLELRAVRQVLVGLDLPKQLEHRWCVQIVGEVGFGPLADLRGDRPRWRPCPVGHAGAPAA
jgi:hypothetical protein